MDMVNWVLVILIDVIPTSHIFSELWAAVKQETIVPHQVLTILPYTGDKRHNLTIMMAELTSVTPLSLAWTTP